MATQITIQNYNLTINGLQLAYTLNGQTNVKTFCPHATCDLLQDFKLIEGFESDRNGEPVILFTDHECGVCRTGFALWFRFVKGFKITHRMAEIFVERLEMTKASAKTHVIINRLMKPLQAAA